jgi:hypothetical protein
MMSVLFSNIQTFKAKRVVVVGGCHPDTFDVLAALVSDEWASGF